MQVNGIQINNEPLWLCINMRMGTLITGFLFLDELIPLSNF